LTAGLTAIFKGPRYLKGVDAVLRPIGVNATSGGDTIEQRLKRLERAYVEGAISEQEYHRLRMSILGGF